MNEEQKEIASLKKQVATLDGKLATTNENLVAVKKEFEAYKFDQEDEHKKFEKKVMSWIRESQI